MKRSEIIELLPWYVNGTLSDDERSAVEAFLRENDDCAEELRLIEGLRRGVVEACTDQATAPDDILDGALSAIDQLPARTEAPVTRGGFGWLTNPSPAVGRLALAAALLLGMATVGMWVRSPETPAPGGITLGGDQLPPGAGADYLVAVAPQVSISQLVDWLDAKDGRIIGGPIGYNGMTVFRVRLLQSADQNLMDDQDDDSPIRIVEEVP